MIRAGETQFANFRPFRFPVTSTRLRNAGVGGVIPGDLGGAQY